MIKDIRVGDITAPNNEADIIIGMNTKLDDVTGIGLPFVRNISAAHPISLGSVLSFKFDEARNVHMLICHSLGKRGWQYADTQVRFGMDYLWHTERNTRQFSIVQIGTGRVGQRDGADPALIYTAIANSHLRVTLFVRDSRESVAETASQVRPLVPYRSWNPIHGEKRLRA